MKTLIHTLSLIAATTATTLTAFAQGRVAFNNEGTFNASDAITINTGNMGMPGGLGGQGIGGDKYSVQLVWVAGSGLTQVQFDFGVQNRSQVVTGVGAGGSANAAFLSVTGPVASGAGFFDAGSVPNPIGTSMPAGDYTMQVLAWYSVGFSSYEAALAGGVNVGRSPLFNVVATAPASSVNSTIFPGFTVGWIPEPSGLSLTGLGAVAVMLFRRKR